MHAIYHTNINELTSEFIQNLKRQFANASVDIVIKSTDETDYLNSTAKNRALLEKSIKEVNAHNLVRKSVDELNL